VWQFVLWPAGLPPKKISLAAPRHPLAVPAGWRFLKGGRRGICYKCHLPNAVQSATSVTITQYNLPFKEHTEANCSEQFTDNKKNLTRKQNNWVPGDEIKNNNRNINNNRRDKIE
jgi:hypothetical protein